MTINRAIDSSVIGLVHSRQVLFSETAAGATYTGTIIIPAGSTLLDILIVPQVLWTAETSAEMKIGDSVDDDGYFSTVDLKATDLVLGERLSAASDGFWGATNGAYLTTAGRFGQQSTNNIGGYFVSEGSIIGVVTRVGTAGAAGRTRMIVTYATPDTANATVA